MRRLIESSCKFLPLKAVASKRYNSTNAAKAYSVKNWVLPHYQKQRLYFIRYSRAIFPLQIQRKSSENPAPHGILPSEFASVPLEGKEMGHFVFSFACHIAPCRQRCDG